MSRDKLLGEEKIVKVLMKLSIPATIAMLVNAIYNIVDTIFIGRGVGSLGIAGIAIYLPIQIIILSLGLLIGVGAASLISRLLGKKEHEKVNYAAGTAFSVIFFICLIVTTIGLTFTEPLLKLFGASKSVLPYALPYAKAMFVGVLFFPICVTSNNIIRSEGNAKHAMISMSIGMIANIFLDYILIFPCNLGILGAGIATTISKFTTLIYLYYYFSRVSSIKIRIKYLKPRMKYLKPILAVGFSAFAIQISTSIVTTLMNKSLVVFGGDTSVAIYGIVYKVMLLQLMPINGLIQGMQPIIGYNKGARNNERIKEALKYTLMLTTFVAIIFMILSFCIPKQIMSLFTNESEIIENGKNILRIVVSMSFVLGIYMTGVGLFQSLGKGRMSLFLSTLRQPILFVPLLLILPNINNLGITGIWLAFPISDLISSTITAIIFYKAYEKNK